MNPDSMSGCVYKNGLPEVVAMIFSVSISFVDTVLAPGDFKKIMKKKGATFAQEIRPNPSSSWCFLYLFQGFSGFDRERTCLVMLRFSLINIEHQGQEGQAAVGAEKIRITQKFVRKLMRAENVP